MIIQTFLPTRANRAQPARPSKWSRVIIFMPVLVVGSVVSIETAIAMSVGFCFGGAVLMAANG